MLIQMPHGSSEGEPPAIAKTDCTPFEAALRRDLANAPIVSYESVIGGWSKRLVDIIVVMLTSPAWLVALAACMGFAAARGRGPVLVADDRIGYGGRTFKLWRVQLAAPSAVIEILRPVGAPPPPSPLFAEGRAAKWRRALERLPQLFSVLSGQMSLVGPHPLRREDVYALRTARRYYLSARPGLIGLGEDDEENVGGPCKVYALSWSIWHDLVIASRAMREFRDRGELWRPRPRLLFRDQPMPAETPAAARRRPHEE